MDEIKFYVDMPEEVSSIHPNSKYFDYYFITNPENNMPYHSHGREMMATTPEKARKFGNTIPWEECGFDPYFEVTKGDICLKSIYWTMNPILIDDCVAQYTADLDEGIYLIINEEGEVLS